MIWNWYWNCDGDPLPSDVPAIPSDTTSIVLNWHWNCSDAAPASPTGSGVTVCVGCNIAIAIRIASPGDSGDVVQTIGATAASIAENAAQAAQNAAQAAQLPPPPAASQPAASDPPRATPPPPATEGPTTGAASSAPLTAAPSSASAPAAPAPAAAAPAVASSVTTGAPATSATTDDPPLHGAPDFALAATAPGTHRAAPAFGARGSRGGPAGPSQLWNLPSLGVAGATGLSVKGGEPQATHATAEATPRRHGVTSPRPTPIVPSAPTPIVLVPTSGGVHSMGTFTSDALAAGAIGALLLVFFAYAAPGLQTARSRYAHVHPDPPG